MEDDSFVQKFIDQVWNIHDGDKSNELDKNKTIQFMQSMLNQIGSNLNESQTWILVDELFDQLDTEGKGTIGKSKIVEFLKRAMNLSQQSKGTPTNQ